MNQNIGLHVAAPPPKIELRLYVGGLQCHSAPAVRNVRSLCEEHLPERFELEIVDVSRVTHSGVTLRRGPVETSTVVRRAIESSRPVLDGAGHALQVLLPAEPLRVDVDPARFEQILVDLLDNAARHTPRGGRIVVSAKRSGGEAIIRVRDDGVGIATGLALVKSLVEMDGGAVEAHGEGAGRGSEVVVRLPLGPADGS
jgi:signal transduction histidine kinase